MSVVPRQQRNLSFGLHLVTKPWTSLELRQIKQVKRAGAYEVLRYAWHGVHQMHNVEIYEESHVFRSILRDAILELGRYSDEGEGHTMAIHCMASS
ncbi:hypothetical protein NDU88_000038 [Pleurodeles waltl]|uniref:Uncharacterized protein n=1 Tax=Pleurodeles waltl TaxID=8319 RepID=A0AAV7V442_PLEWA|nr:hypothetical protein NDU88_000038 [Pleurodeles waltl]